MRKLMLAASAAALLAGISMASAADVTGTIKSIDVTTNMITLEDGKSYKLSASIKPGDWKVGDRVRVTYDDASGQMTATALVRVFDVTGTIKSIDVATNMITLEDGKSYKLSASIKPADWKVGDKVKVTYDPAGGQMTAVALEKAS